MDSTRVVKVDLHNHFRTSSRMKGLYPKVIQITARRLGIGGVVGLINFSDRRYEHFIDEADTRDYHNLGNAAYFPINHLLVVRGQEVPTKQGHLLVIGLPRDKHIREERTLQDTLKEAKDNNGIIIADHPFYHKGFGEYLKKHLELINQLDAIEVHNGEAALELFGLLPRGANQRAQGFFKGINFLNKELGKLYSSDGHSVYEIGSSWTALRMPADYSKFRDREEVTSALRNAIRRTGKTKFDYEAHNSRMGAFRHALILQGVIPLAEMVGSTYFETDRPEQTSQ